jgi:hypothetical protein
VDGFFIFSLQARLLAPPNANSAASRKGLHPKEGENKRNARRLPAAC